MGSYICIIIYEGKIRIILKRLKIGRKHAQLACHDCQTNSLFILINVKENWMNRYVPLCPTLQKIIALLTYKKSSEKKTLGEKASPDADRDTLRT